jgi:hypothetical protein
MAHKAAFVAVTLTLAASAPARLARHTSEREWTPNFSRGGNGALHAGVSASVYIFHSVGAALGQGSAAARAEERARRSRSSFARAGAVWRSPVEVDETTLHEGGGWRVAVTGEFAVANDVTFFVKREMRTGPHVPQAGTLSLALLEFSFRLRCTPLRKSSAIDETIASRLHTASVRPTMMDTRRSRALTGPDAWRVVEFFVLRLVCPLGMWPRRTDEYRFLFSD